MNEIYTLDNDIDKPLVSACTRFIKRCYKAGLLADVGGDISYQIIHRYFGDNVVPKFGVIKGSYVHISFPLKDDTVVKLVARVVRTLSDEGDVEHLFFSDWCFVYEDGSHHGVLTLYNQVNMFRGLGMLRAYERMLDEIQKHLTLQFYYTLILSDPYGFVDIQKGY